MIDATELPKELGRKRFERSSDSLVSLKTQKRTSELDEEPEKAGKNSVTAAVLR